MLLLKYAVQQGLTAMSVNKNKVNYIKKIRTKSNEKHHNKYSNNEGDPRLTSMVYIFIRQICFSILMITCVYYKAIIFCR